MSLPSQPVGPLVHSRLAKRPERVTLSGRAVTLVPLDVDRHADALFPLANGGERDRVWTYLADGPYAESQAFKASIAAKAKSDGPLFFAVIDNASGGPVGYQTLMRIDDANRVIEIGNVLYTPTMQRTIGATEAQYLFAVYVFDTLGYRRYEWKCNDLNGPSKRAAQSLGFTFEGVFRQHVDRQGAQPRHRVVLDAQFGMAASPRGVRALAFARQFRRFRSSAGLSGEPRQRARRLIRSR